MSRINAEAAVAALQDLNGGALFNLIQGNPHIIEKHYKKAAAQQAAADDGHPQGYFKRETRTEVSGLADYRGLSDNKKSTVRQLIGNPKDNKAVSRLIGRYNSNHDERLAVYGSESVDSSAVMDIVYLLLNSPARELRRARGDANAQNTRFVVTGAIPDGFAGRSIDANGAKTYNVDYAVVVISAPGGLNPQIVTAFPADQAYAQGTPALV